MVMQYILCKISKIYTVCVFHIVSSLIYLVNKVLYKYSMAQHTFIAYIDELKNVADKIGENLFFNSKIKINRPEVSADELLKMAKMSLTNFFYVIRSDRNIVFTDFDFTFSPPDWDKDFVHIWNNDLTVRLYNRDNIIKSSELYADSELSAGNIKLKVLNNKIYTYPLSDIVFISYDEELANDRYNDLTQRFPRALRVHGVEGIYNAHKIAASVVSTELFYVVDADAVVLPTFDFSYSPTGYDCNSVHVWHSQNPINDLEYGYGGIKLFPTQDVINYTGAPIDFTTTVSKHFKIMPEVSNITQFNTDPFSAWRSGFRECTKLASKLIANQDNAETEYRLHQWCTVGADREFGEFAIIGANDGKQFGMTHKNQPELLGLINDYNWLEDRFQR